MDDALQQFVLRGEVILSVILRRLLPCGKQDGTPADLRLTASPLIRLSAGGAWLGFLPIAACPPVPLPLQRSGTAWAVPIWAPRRRPQLVGLPTRP